ncbi:uncharacterized protein LOC120276215 [Dioscorea cayenensis subsp. rotundata]|uniref:Uncharacterized protein LOC120276215 n=1 Tax=Dioscorea cayennensis subsp. rotundata TaxID=55577 RepID=A0AB40CJD5_DIOCR|nr:uncharacterized protein LOC120276215 [Dioscorea cayenensis subsp. rotundata]
MVDKRQCTCSCRRLQLSGIPCGHAISVLYYNKETPENYLDNCYKVTTFMNTYKNILNPTHDKDSWPKSDQGHVIPPEPVNQRRGRKTLLRRKEAEENQGFTNGKVSKRGVKMRCSVCGETGHNKRYHGLKGNRDASGGQTHGEASRGESITTDDQTAMNDALRLIDENERAEANTEAGGEYHITPPTLDHQVSQFITIPVQAIHEATPLVEYSMRQQQHESGIPVTRVPIIPNQKAHVELPIGETPVRRPKITIRSKKARINEGPSSDANPPFKNPIFAAIVPKLRSQGNQKDVKEGSRGRGNSVSSREEGMATTVKWLLC